MLVIVIVGVNFYVVFNQIKLQASRRQMQHDLTNDFIRFEKQVTDDRPKH